MRSYNSEVKVYKRKKYKQYIINLKQDNPFNEGETVIIYPESEITQYMADNKSLEDTVKQREITINKLNENLTELEELKEYKNKYEAILNDMDRLRASKDHLQERYNKSQDEVIQLEKELSKFRIAITKVQSLSFMDRIFNRLPDDVKELNAAPENK